MCLYVCVGMSFNNHYSLFSLCRLGVRNPDAPLQTTGMLTREQFIQVFARSLYELHTSLSWSSLCGCVHVDASLPRMSLIQRCTMMSRFNALVNSMEGKKRLKDAVLAGKVVIIDNGSYLSTLLSIYLSHAH